MLQYQFVYYIPNVVVQITTVAFLTQANPSLQYITTPIATAVASAQSLRITRKLWKLATSKHAQTVLYHRLRLRQAEYARYQKLLRLQVILWKHVDDIRRLQILGIEKWVRNRYDFDGRGRT
jgi:hypothetical protein